MVVVGEHLFMSKPRPALARLSDTDQIDLYKQIAPIAGSALGFLLASVAILVSLDPKRPIVADLRRGEAFSLLIANLLAACLWLLLLSIFSLVGWTFHSSCGSSDAFQSVFEVIGYAAVVELLLGGFFFGYVTYKVAKHD
ncbi:hypothetical protein [Conexibacter sp. CPCC 206217]|uniref:hypothetical protein n=1 Tax=Conexibacter sp. CPCC 206217 TaxID=3064574 RepID=UPI00272617CE|nr:hypothetical protein [Conexibacter sp. CPCC 206217]MDO8211012.1 hypothetical protein [Conexibacter sp. CPCC 206217]